MLSKDNLLVFANEKIIRHYGKNNLYDSVNGKYPNTIDLDFVMAQTSFSAREIEVLQWAADGKTYRETAKILGISESTVIQYMRQSCLKLEAPNKVSAVVKAINKNLIAVS